MPPSYALEVTVERVHAAIVEAGLRDPILVGHSASASVAAMYATQHPTSGIVLVEGTFLVAPFAEMLRSMEPVLRGPGFGAAWSRISEYAFRLDEVPAVSGPSSRRRAGHDRMSSSATGRTSSHGRPPSCRPGWTREQPGCGRSGLPVTSVVGQDPSADEAAWLEANLPEARMDVWPGSGHFPHLAHPRAFAELLAPMGVPSDSVA